MVVPAPPGSRQSPTASRRRPASRPRRAPPRRSRRRPDTARSSSPADGKSAAWAGTVQRRRRDGASAQPLPGGAKAPGRAIRVPRTGGRRGFGTTAFPVHRYVSSCHRSAVCFILCVPLDRTFILFLDAFQPDCQRKLVARCRNPRLTVPPTRNEFPMPDPSQTLKPMLIDGQWVAQENGAFDSVNPPRARATSASAARHRPR